jgi:arylsulfatase
LVNTPAHLIDLMATCVDLAGGGYPKEHTGQVIQPMEGVSLAPAFTEKTIQRPLPLFWEHEGNRAIRKGQWKLVSKHPGPWELYDMEADRTETRDLAAAQPVRVQSMAAAWDTWAKRVGVRPWPLNGGAGKKGRGKGKK